MEKGDVRGERVREGRKEREKEWRREGGREREWDGDGGREREWGREGGRERKKDSESHIIILYCPCVDSEITPCGPVLARRWPRVSLLSWGVAPTPPHIPLSQENTPSPQNIFVFVPFQSLSGCGTDRLIYRVICQDADSRPRLSLPPRSVCAPVVSVWAL